jgi:hypothetical protein
LNVSYPENGARRADLTEKFVPFPLATLPSVRIRRRLKLVGGCVEAVLKNIRHIQPQSRPIRVAQREPQRAHTRVHGFITFLVLSLAPFP